MNARYASDENTPPADPDNPSDRWDRNSYSRRFAHLHRTKLCSEVDDQRRELKCVHNDER